MTELAEDERRHDFPDERLEFTADRTDRLDRLLAQVSGESRALVQQWIAAGVVTINGTVARKSGEKVRAGDRVTAIRRERPALRAVPEKIPVCVVYEDDDLLVVDKPAGLTVHPAPGHPQGTLVNALLGRGVPLATEGTAAFRPGVVHRIDKDTSGLLVVAKSELAYAGLARQFRRHTIHRRYLALIHGVPDPPRGTLQGAIGRDPVHRQRLTIVTEGKGKPAITHYEVVESWPAAAQPLAKSSRGKDASQQAGNGYSLVQMRLETGRTHQIRVHMAAFGHPLVSDPVYCPPKLLARDRERFAFAGQALHAAELGFEHPATGRWMQFVSPLPAAFQAAIDQLRHSEAG